MESLSSGTILGWQQQKEKWFASGVTHRVGYSTEGISQRWRRMLKSSSLDHALPTHLLLLTTPYSHTHLPLDHAPFSRDCSVGKLERLGTDRSRDSGYPLWYQGRDVSTIDDKISIPNLLESFVAPSLFGSLLSPPHPSLPSLPSPPLGLPYRCPSWPRYKTTLFCCAMN